MNFWGLTNWKKLSYNRIQSNVRLWQASRNTKYAPGLLRCGLLGFSLCFVWDCQKTAKPYLKSPGVLFSHEANMNVKISVNSIALDRKIPPGDSLWGTYNDAFRNMELEVVEIANYIYGGHAYTSWHKGRRKLENFVCSQFIAVDMDTEDERSSFAQLQQHELVSIYGGLMYTTPNHTDAKPRTRVIFFLDQPIECADAFNAAARFMIAQFDGADTSCSDASRFFYGSKNCQVWFTDNILPLEHLRHYYKDWKSRQPKPRPQHQPVPLTEKGDSPDKLEEVREALRRIDPWAIDYKQWIAILAALHDEFGAKALSLAVAWGKGSDGEVEAKWKTFGKYSGNRAGLGSIFELAKTH